MTDHLLSRPAHQTNHVEKGGGDDEGFEVRRSGCGENGKETPIFPMGRIDALEPNGTDAMGKQTSRRVDALHHDVGLDAVFDDEGNSRKPTMMCGRRNDEHDRQERPRGDPRFGGLWLVVY